MILSVILSQVFDRAIGRYPPLGLSINITRALDHDLRRERSKIALFKFFF